ncbi:hypothetical protein ACQ4PT_017802 [Festuca glaucescens]
MAVDESDSRRTQEDQRERQQTTTPNPGTYQEQYIHDLLSNAVADGKLDLAQRRGARETNASKELLLTTTLEESWITNASCCSLQQSPSCEEPDLLSLKLHNALLLSTFVCSLVPTGLFIKYFTRMDKKGFFHIYPDRGGPFQTLEEAQKAINTHHAVQRKNMCMEGLTDEEKAVRNALYWYHDGTRKHSAEAFASCTTRRPTRELVKALLDTHNEDNDLLGDDAYELIDIVRHKECFDGKGCIYRSYSHFNLTMKTKGADANSDLYFAEVTRMRGDYEAYVLTCICVVKPDDNGKCHVCEVNMKDMKHPTDDVYNHGRCPKLRVRSHRSGVNGVDLFEKLFSVHDEAWLNAEEARVRRMIKEGKEARSKLEVDNRRDEKIKKIKESRRKLEVGNKGDDHGKRDKYVVPARRK